MPNITARCKNSGTGGDLDKNRGENSNRRPRGPEPNSAPLALMSGAALAALKAHDWPGNVRELQNVVERAVITARHGPISFELPSSPDARQGSERLGDASVVHVRTEGELREAERANVL